MISQSQSQSQSRLLWPIWFTASSIMILKITFDLAAAAVSSSSSSSSSSSPGQALVWMKNTHSGSDDKTLNQYPTATTKYHHGNGSIYYENYYDHHDHVEISNLIRDDQQHRGSLYIYANSNTTIFSPSSVTSPDTITPIASGDGSAYGIYSSQTRIAGSGLGVFLLLTILTAILTVVSLATEVYLRFYYEDATSISSKDIDSGEHKATPRVNDGALVFAKIASQLPTLIRKGKFSAINNFLGTLLVDCVHDTNLFNQTDSSTGITPLELAAFTGNLNTVERLLQHNVRVCDTHIASELPDSKIITSPRGLSPIWWALKGLQDRLAGRGNATTHEVETLKVIRLLIASNADIHSIPLHNLPKTKTAPLPPLHLACRLGFPSIVNLILRADRERTTTSVIPHLRDHADHSTALHIAAKYNHTSILESLLVKTTKIDIEAQDKHGNTPLRIASREGNTLVVEYLLDQHAADIEARDETGSTPLLCAVKYREEGVLRALLSRGADLRSTMGGTETALHVSAVQGHVSVLRILLGKFNKDDEMVGYLEETNSDGKTALHLSCEYGKFDMAKELLSTHPSPETYIRMTDNQGYTPLHYACMNTPLTSPSAHSELIRLLLAYNPSINAVSRSNLTTPLHYACRGPALPILGTPRKGETEVVKLLLEHGADVEAEDRDGKRPVHWTVPMRFFKLEDAYSGVVLGLLKDLGGANVDVKDGKGRTVRGLAFEGGYMEALKVLGKGNERNEEDMEEDMD